MYWEDEGFIISKNKFRENDIILEVFTNSYGKVSGIVYGGTSRKVKNYLQLTNKIFVTYTAKNENKIGYFKTELVDAISPKYFNSKKKILCLNSLSSILKCLLPENQSYNNIFSSLDTLLHQFDKENWIINYVIWELNLINNLGFGFKINNKNFTGEDLNTICKIKIDNVTYEVPVFIIVKKYDNLNKNSVYYGLNFCRNLMENKFFNPNNIKFPHSRKLLENNFV